jgi:hypothetical protein
MATAPRPRSENDGERRVWVRIRDQEWVFDFRDFNTADRFAVRKATGGLSLESFTGETAFGLDSLAVFIFLARRKDGEPGLKWDDHEAWFDVLVDGLEEGEFEAEMGAHAGDKTHPMDDGEETPHPLG